MKGFLIHFLTTLLCFSTVILKAEHPDSNHATSGYIAFNIGAGSPIGAFAATNSTDYKGYAKVGLGYGGTLSLPLFHSHFGPAITFDIFSNKFDDSTYAAHYPRYGGNPAGNPSYYDNKIIMVGLLYTYAINDLSFDARLMGGINYCLLPNTSYNVPFTIPAPGHSPTGDVAVGTNSSKTSGFAIGSDITFRYAVIDHALGFLVKFGFIYSNPHYNTTAVEDPTHTSQTVTVAVSGNMPILILSAEAGIFCMVGK